MRKYLLLAFTLALSLGLAAQKKILSKSFELRYVTSDAKANGESDFKGSTEWFNTDKRISYLKHYADYATRYFGDEMLNHPAVSQQELTTAMNQLKPQPQPQIRHELHLIDWRWYGYRSGEQQLAQDRISYWKSLSANVTITDGRLIFIDKATVTVDIKPQSWRYHLTLDLNSQDSRILLRDSKTGKTTCEVGIRSRQAYYISNGQRHEVKSIAVGMQTWKLEIDQTSEKRFNLKIGEQLFADFPLLTDTTATVSDQFIIEGSRGTQVDNIWGVGYTKTTDAKRINMPYYAATFLDDNFDVRQNVDNWYTADYDDTFWQSCRLPKNHGSERYEGEDLYLRKIIHVDSFERAFFYLESLFPSGELWVNNRIAEVIKNPHPQMIDVTKYLRKDSYNLVALKINSFKATKSQMMHHCPTDPNIGWFAGRAKLILTAPTHITNVYVCTNDLRGDTAVVTVEVTVKNEEYTHYNGKVCLMLKDWFPEEAIAERAVDSISVALYPQQEKTFKTTFNVPNAHLWTVAHPQLYQVHALLVNDQSGKKKVKYTALDGDLSETRDIIISKLTDDYILTTGFRTIDQEGGTFCINRKPELLKAPLLFGQRFPLATISKDLLCASSEDLMKELLAFKKMNCNGVRMSVHWSDNYGQDGTNDPRLLEMGDQLGLMYIWTTASWIRVYSPFSTDYDGLADYVRQVRNAPSIVIWQTANHPDLSRWSDAMTYYHQIYNIIYPLDTTRLITPTADLRHMGPHNDDGTLDKNGKPDPKCDPVWIAPQIARGSMDYPTGFGQDWEYLRRWPQPRHWKGNVSIKNFLDSKQRAYFNFEQEESIGQLNWNLYRGSPMYKYHSYEWDYDKGSIGRLLSCEEWKESQAWQAFSAYECVRKMRWLDYDGLSWCCMWGGPNMGTYQKPLLDNWGNKKLSYYANRMGFQTLLAGSHDVDMTYGPADEPEIIVENLGPEKHVNVLVIIQNDKRKIVYQKKYRNISLKAGRTNNFVTKLSIRSLHLPDGFYFFNYQILK